MGWLQGDPLAEVRPRRVRQKERLRLSRTQLIELIECTENPRDRGMLAAACNTGLRASDLCALRIKDVDLDQGLLRVEVQKTGDLDRLPITSDLEVELRRWLSWYSTRLAKRGQALTGEAYLFPAMNVNNGTERGGFYGDPKPLAKQQHPARVVHRALIRIGIYATSHEGLHTIRRSFGRAVFEMASAEGHDAALRITAAQLGHKNTATTEGYLGIAHDRVKRDRLLKGRSILGSVDPENVTSLVREA